nr:MAG TPA: hypothetical protein [Caudoviricetes sp.]
MVRTFPQFSYHFCPFYNASVLTERLRFAILKTVQMSGDCRHQRPLTSLEKTRFMVEWFALSCNIFQ